MGFWSVAGGGDVEDEEVEEVESSVDGDGFVGKVSFGDRVDVGDGRMFAGLL